MFSNHIANWNLMKIFSRNLSLLVIHTYTPYYSTHALTLFSSQIEILKKSKDKLALWLRVTCNMLLLQRLKGERQQIVSHFARRARRWKGNRDGAARVHTNQRKNRIKSCPFFPLHSPANEKEATVLLISSFCNVRHRSRAHQSEASLMQSTPSELPKF